MFEFGDPIVVSFRHALHIGSHDNEDSFILVLDQWKFQSLELINCDLR